MLLFYHASVPEAPGIGQFARPGIAGTRLNPRHRIKSKRAANDKGYGLSFGLTDRLCRLVSAFLPMKLFMCDLMGQYSEGFGW